MNSVDEFRLFDSRHDPALDFLFFQVHRLLERQRNIFINGHGIEKRIVLKHVTHPPEGGIPLFFGHPVQRLSPEKNSPFIRFEQTDDMLEKNAFPPAAEADDGCDLPFIDLQVDPVQNGSVSEAFRHVLKFNQWYIHKLL
ncbi:MAG: hypothetical protein A4E74_02240 [Syntrophus sp. PtaB.Bin075]|nr:MAG: hypothetical protein A4E74_02240 [Syntrophus sp. PtaB.Bin075]